MEEPLAFINYRTEDTGAAAMRLLRALSTVFGPERVFLDARGIEGGDVWSVRLQDALDRATVLFALIGKRWTEVLDPSTGRPRLEKDDDWVRREIEFALARGRDGVQVVPVLIDDAKRPSEHLLPVGMRALGGLQTRPLRTNDAFEVDVQGLIALLINKGFSRRNAPGTLDADAVYARVDLPRFVGRGWLRQRLDAFLGSARSGYFVIEGDSGSGKTSFLAHLVSTRGYIQHFVELAPGRAGIVAGLRNLAAQLIAQFGLKPQLVNDLIGEIGVRADFLERLLVQAAAGRRASDGPVVLVVDGLDGAGTPDGQNVLGLPRRLPEGFFFVVSQRPTEVRLETDAAREVTTLVSSARENLADLGEYVASFVREEPMQRAIVARSQGNWVYAYHVCREIREGVRSAADLNGLPRGLWQYYARFWSSWRASHESRWPSSHLPFLGALSAARERLPLSTLAKFAAVPSDELHRLVDTDWRPFLSVTGESPHMEYGLYHASLSDFMHGAAPEEGLTSAEKALRDELRVATQERHAAIARSALARWGEVEIPTLRTADPDSYRNEYAWRHLVEHLGLAGDVDTLRQLLRAEWKHPIETRISLHRPSWLESILLRMRGQTEFQVVEMGRSAWFESHARTGDLALFLDDWKTAESRAEDIVFRMQGRLVRASVRSATFNVRFGVAAALLRAGRWSPQQALTYAHAVPNMALRARLLADIAPLAGADRESVLREAIDTADSLPDAVERADAYAGLLEQDTDPLTDEIIGNALHLFRELEPQALARVGPRFVPYLVDDEVAEYLECVAAHAPLDRLRILIPSFDEAPDGSALDAVARSTIDEAIDAAKTRHSRADRAFELATIIALLGTRAAFLVEPAFEEATTAMQESLDPKPFEALFLLLEVFPTLLQGDSLARMVEELLAVALAPGRLPAGILFPALIGSITTSEQARSQAAGWLIRGAPLEVLDRIEKRVLATEVRFNDWEHHAGLALRRARLGEQERSLQIIGRMTSGPWRDKALADIVPLLNIDGVRRALQMMDDERRHFARTTTFEDARRFDIEEAELTLPSLQALIPRLAELGESDEAFERLERLRYARVGKRDDWNRIAEDIAPHLSVQRLDQLLPLTMEFHDVEDCIFTLAQLSPFLGLDRARHLAASVELISHSHNKVTRTSWHNSSRWSSIFISHVEQRYGSIPPVAGRLIELGAASEARGLLSRFRRETHGEVSSCIAELARTAPPDIVEMLLGLVAEHNDADRPRVFEALARHLSSELASQALALALSIPDRCARAWSVGALIGYVDGKQRASLARSAMADLNSTDIFVQRSRVIGLLAPHLDVALDECKRLVRDREKGCLDCLDGVLESAPPALANEMFALAGEHLTTPEILELARHLPESLFFDRLRQIPERVPNSVLASVAGRLDALGQTIPALEHVLRISDVFVRARAARELRPSLLQVDPEVALRFLTEGSSAEWERASRRGAFQLASALAPLVMVVGGEDAVAELYSVVQRTHHWWHTF